MDSKINCTNRLVGGSSVRPRNATDGHGIIAAKQATGLRRHGPDNRFGDRTEGLQILGFDTQKAGFEVVMVGHQTTPDIGGGPGNLQQSSRKCPARAAFGQAQTLAGL